MKPTTFLIAVSMAPMLLSSSLAATGRVDLDARSAYVWRGVTYNTGTVLQPSAELVSDSGCGVRLWGNYDTTGYATIARAGDFSEIDATGFYTERRGHMAGTVGVTHYTYHRLDDTPDSSEVFLQGAFDSDPWALVVAVYYDVDEYDDFYSDVTLSHGFLLAKALAVEVAVSAGYVGDGLSPGGKAGWSDASAAVNAAWSLTPTMTVGASLVYTDRLDPDVIPSTPANTHGGIHLTWRY